MTTLHLMTQRGQPYGSRRKCCEICGTMLVARPDAFWLKHTWTDDPAWYRPWPADGSIPRGDLTPCDRVDPRAAAAAESYGNVTQGG